MPPAPSSDEEGEVRSNGGDEDMDLESDREEESSDHEEDDDGFMAFPDSDDEGEVCVEEGKNGQAGRGEKEEGGGGGAAAVNEERLCRPLYEVPWFRSRPAPSTGQQHKLVPLMRLHNEILDFCDLLAPTRAELDDRHRVTKIVVDTVKEIWPHYDIQTFGSEATKVFLPESDIDMVLLPPHQLDVQRVRNNLFKAADKFKQQPAVTAMEIIAKARVPIIKLRFNNVQVDVSFSGDSGLKSARYMLERMEALPPLRPLILVLKYFLSQRGLNETYIGGCGSFLIQLMIISFLQHKEKEAAQAGADRSENLGTLLLGFLKLYGHDYHVESVGMSVLRDGIYFKKMERGFWDMNRPWVLAVENPLDTTMDVGKNSYMMNTIVKSFAQAYTRLHNAIVSPPAGSPQSLLSYVIRPDEVLTNRPMPKKSIFMTKVFSPKVPYAPVIYEDNYEEDARHHHHHHRHRDEGRRGGGGNGREVRLVRDKDIENDYVEYSDDRDRERERGQKRGRWSGGRREDETSYQLRGDYEAGRYRDSDKRRRY